MYLVAQLYDLSGDSDALKAHLTGEYRRLIEGQPGLAHFTVNWCDPGPDGSPPPFAAIALAYWQDRQLALDAAEKLDASISPASGLGPATTIWAKTEQKRAFGAVASPGTDEIASSVGIYNPPADPASFDEHFRNVHSEYAAAIPGVTSFTMNWAEPGPDGAVPPYYFVSALEWDTRESLNAGLSAPETARAVEDLPNFAGAGMHMTVGPAKIIV